ncbi:MAG: ABC transporter ATP-binding protein [Elusimicrobia bacterium]|nr:ABC transporter ATP-binding protein [Elusimicrobiota bacterium]
MTEHAESAIVIEGLRRSFSRKTVLAGITAKAGAGRVVGLLGRNGEGKTTLLRVLLDLLAADSGRVEVLGMTPDGAGAIRAKVGYVPERPAFHDFMTVGQALDLRRRFFPTWSADKAASLCARLGLDLGLKVRDASKGAVGKLAWVCAAAHDPELFLLDEPTSGLDALVRDDILTSLISELHDRGRTFLIANHRMEEMAGLLDEVWVLGGAVLTTYDAGSLRKARRVFGRLKAASKPPVVGRALAVVEDGSLREWTVLDEEAAREIAASGAVEGLETLPVAFEETLKCLLAQAGGTKP